MNRRMFTKTLAAVFTLPALPAPSFAAAPAVSVPSQARYWAIYMDSLHGTCTPKALQTMLNIPASQAEGYLSQMMLDGTIKPNHLLQALRKPTSTPKADLFDRLKARFDKKAQELAQEAKDEILSDPEVEETPETIDEKTA